MFNATVITKYATTTPLPVYIDPDINLSVNGVAKSILQEMSNGILIIDGIPEVSQITTSGNIGFALDGKYFTLDTPNQGYYIWFEVANSGNDPLVAGRTGIPVNLTAGVTSANSVATILAATLSSYSPIGGPLNEFIAPPPGANIVTISNGTQGNVLNSITDGIGIRATGFPLAVITAGTGTIAVGDHLLVKDEPVGKQQYNGIYIVQQTGSALTPWIIERDFSVIFLKQGDTVYTSSGSTQAGILTILDNNITMPGQIGSPANFTVIMGTGGVSFDSIAPLGSPDKCGGLIVRTDSTSQAGMGDSWTVLNPGSQGQFLQVAQSPVAPPENQQCLVWTTVDAQTVLGNLLTTNGDMLIVKNGTINKLPAGANGEFLNINTTLYAATGGVGWDPINFKNISPTAVNCGDIMVYDGAQWQTLPNPGVLGNNNVLTVDTTAGLCVTWKAFSASAVGGIGAVQYTDGAGNFSAASGFEFGNYTADSLTIPDVGRYAIKGTSSRTLLYAPHATNPSTSTNVAVGGSVSNAITGNDNLILGSGSYLSAAAALGNIIIGNGTGANIQNGTDVIALGHNSFGVASNPSDMIGIGTHVFDSYASSAVRSGNIAVGFSSQFSHTAGVGNVSVGSQSLQSMTGTGNNTVIGHYAANRQTVGQRTSAFGFNAMLNNTTGNNCCAFGWSALAGDVAGVPIQDMCAFGYQALTAVDGTGLTNNAFGNYSLSKNVSGSGNNAFGFNSLLNNIIGNYNSAFGHQTLYTNNSNYNSAFGYNAMYTNNSGSDNCAFGSQALFNNNSGNRNNAFGSSSGINISIGSNNNAFGYQTMFSMTSGSNNCAFGDNALVAAISTSDNSAFGYLAMNNASTGSRSSAFGSGSLTRGNNNNCAFGYQALGSNLLSVGNMSAFGYQALVTNTTGTDNNAFGYTTLSANTTGDDNCAFGSNALNTNISGNANCAFGNNALTSITTTSNNTAMGYNAGQNVSGGSADNNTLIGYQAGRNITAGQNTVVGSNSGTTITTGTNNVIVGYNVNVDIAARAGCILLGNGAVVTKDNTIGLPTRATNNGAALSAGAATALPVKPTTYLEVNIGGTIYSIPLYT